jgi:formylglycine-generating enzyme required for sulfatase activity
VRSEFTDEQWRLVTELADHPNRLLVTATPEGSETYAEVAHEAVFRRWRKLRDWIGDEREFLAWRSGLEAARHTWQGAPDRSKPDALLMGFALVQARQWLARRRDDLSDADRKFIARSRKAAWWRKRKDWVQVGLALPVVVTGMFVVLNERWFTMTRPYEAEVRRHVLTAEGEQNLKPGDSFKECAKDCPEMVVVPAGEFIMGSPASERGRDNSEEPQHKVVFAGPFAVAKFDVTFRDWDTCVTHPYPDLRCPSASDSGYGRGPQPVINVTWDDAQNYVKWLSQMTGKPYYRLLSEAEFEYAARAWTQTAYPWGEEIGKNNANCRDCGSKWDNRQPSPVGSFAANRFGLYDMHGNVWQWTADCYHENYSGAPQDGSAWVVGANCNQRVVRGGSWVDLSPTLRSAHRHRNSTDFRDTRLGFRVGRKIK